MKPVLIIITALNITFLLMHEFDACNKGEWKMFKFLGKLNDKVQYQIFLWIHFPLCVFLLYFFWCTTQFKCFPLWMTINGIAFYSSFICNKMEIKCV